MPIRLSDAEITAIERANTVLLAPFAYENGEVWRRAAARAVEDCLGGHASSFAAPFAGEPLLTAESDVMRALQALDPPPDWVDGNSVPNSVFQTRSASYRISATILDNYASPTAIKVLALVERIARDALDARSLAKQYDLTRREIEIAQLLRQGLATREMSTVLGISVNTVRRHVEQIFLKLDVHTRTAAVARLTGSVS